MDGRMDGRTDGRTQRQSHGNTYGHMHGRVDMAIDGTVATITLHHPARRNAMTRAMWRSLRALVHSLNSSEIDSCSRNTGGAHGAIEAISSIDSAGPIQTENLHPLRCIIIRGEGAQFCAGGDISEYPSFRFDETSLRHFHEEEVAPALHALLACDVPLVAQIEGNCMGGGLEIAACCDIRVAGESALFGAPIAKLGMPMAPQELAIVLRAAGEATVREMLLEARLFSANQMHARGFVQRVVIDSAVASEALATAQRICVLSPLAARRNKQAFREFYQEKTFESAVDSAQAAIKNIVNTFDYADHAEHREGIDAFLNKRPARF